jgi:RNA polymerase sigma-70 factor (ECF subfamily)
MGDSLPDGRIEKQEERKRRLVVIPGKCEPEEALVREAVTSPDALEELCDLYVPRIYNFVLKRVGKVQDAEDITSTVFEKVLLNLESFDSGKASFSTWIYRITINSVTDYYRGRARRRETSLEDSGFEMLPGGDSGVERLGRYLAVLDLLDGLPSKYQEALTLRYFGSLKVLEVAEVLGISETAASKRILRGLEELRRVALTGVLEGLL